MKVSQFDDTLTGHETHDRWIPIHIPKGGAGADGKYCLRDQSNPVEGLSRLTVEGMGLLRHTGYRDLKAIASGLSLVIAGDGRVGTRGREPVTGLSGLSGHSVRKM